MSRVLHLRHLLELPNACGIAKFAKLEHGVRKSIEVASSYEVDVVVVELDRLIVVREVCIHLDVSLDDSLGHSVV